MNKLIIELYKHDIIKQGEFTLKSGSKSDIYIDLRSIISYPDLLEQVSEFLYKEIEHKKFDHLCGIAYTGIPIATYISFTYEKRMIIKRKEQKKYGTKKLVEGVFQTGDICLLIDDVITSGGSIRENIVDLRENGLEVNNVIVFVDRTNGKCKEVEGVTITSLITLDEVKKIIDDYIDAACKFYQRKLVLTRNPINKKLLNIMIDKKTNLAFAADLTEKNKLLKIVDLVGPYICILKTHIDILEDFDKTVPIQLRKLADKHRFLILEDRKFADIGNTVKNQFHGGIHKISQWCDLVTVHGIMGPKSLEAFDNKVGVLLLGQVSSKGNLINTGYTKQIVEMAESHRDKVVGFISQEKIAGDDFIYLTPGVKLSSGSDSLGQQYNAIGKVLGKRESDIIIVGRGIISKIIYNDIVKAAKMYQEVGWKIKTLT